MADYDHFGEQARALRAKAEELLTLYRQGKGATVFHSVENRKMLKAVEALRSDFAKAGLKLENVPAIKADLEYAEFIGQEIVEGTKPDGRGPAN